MGFRVCAGGQIKPVGNAFREPIFLSILDARTRTTTARTAKMDLSNVKKIVHTSDDREVNLFLEAGWMLITTASMTTDSREYSGPMIKYSLGWTQDGAPVMPKLY
jgi:hypothetical protein